jgi:hypothetical protein
MATRSTLPRSSRMLRSPTLASHMTDSTCRTRVPTRPQRTLPRMAEARCSRRGTRQGRRCGMGRRRQRRPLTALRGTGHTNSCNSSSNSSNSIRRTRSLCSSSSSSSSSRLTSMHRLRSLPRQRASSSIPSNRPLPAAGLARRGMTAAAHTGTWLRLPAPLAAIHTLPARGGRTLTASPPRSRPCGRCPARPRPFTMSQGSTHRRITRSSSPPQRSTLSTRGTAWAQPARHPPRLPQPRHRRCRWIYRLWHNFVTCWPPRTARLRRPDPPPPCP